MNIIIIGYGSMGRQVEKVILGRNHLVIARVDPVCGSEKELTEDIAARADCAVDFSLPEAVLSNVKKYCSFGLNAVVGTTGWDDKKEEVRKIVAASGIGFLYGSNFSLGAHIFLKLVARAAGLINSLPEYDIMGYELHHSRKKDSPSGTALAAARTILENNINKKVIVTERLDRAIKKEELHFASVRGGSIPGIHRVLLDSEADTIEISHSARSRQGMAFGSVLAAEWLAGKTGFYSVDDFIDGILK